MDGAQKYPRPCDWLGPGIFQGGGVLEFSRRQRITGRVLEISRGGPGIFQYPPQKIFLTCLGFEVKGPNTSSRAFLIADLLLK